VIIGLPKCCQLLCLSFIPSKFGATRLRVAIGAYSVLVGRGKAQYCRACYPQQQKLKQISTFSTLKFSISFTSGVGAAFATKFGARFGNARVDARITDIKTAFEASIEALKAFSLRADMATHLEVSLIDCLFLSATALLVERSTGIEKPDASITKTIAKIAAIFIIEPGKNIALHGREERKKWGIYVTLHCEIFRLGRRHDYRGLRKRRALACEK
jgi:hypothetical protein